MTVLLILLGWLLGAVPSLFVLRATVKRHDQALDAIREQHLDVLAERDKRVELDIAEAVKAERERIHEINSAKRARDLKPVAARIY